MREHHLWRRPRLLQRLVRDLHEARHGLHPDRLRGGAAAEAGFFRAIAAGEIQAEPITPTDARRIADLIETYADLGLGGTDASLIALAERLNLTRIATLDQVESQHSVENTRPSRLPAVSQPVDVGVVGAALIDRPPGSAA